MTRTILTVMLLLPVPAFAAKTTSPTAPAEGPGILRLIDDLAKIADEPSLELRETLARNIGASGRALWGHVPLLVKLLENPAPRVRDSALFVTRFVGWPATAATAALCDIATNDPDPDLRNDAIWALGEIAPPPADVVPALQAIVNDPNASGHVKLTAIRVLETYRPEATRPAGPEVLRMLSDAIARIQDNDGDDVDRPILDALTAHVASEDVLTRANATLALTQITGDDDAVVAAALDLLPDMQEHNNFLPIFSQRVVQPRVFEAMVEQCQAGPDGQHSGRDSIPATLLLFCVREEYRDAAYPFAIQTVRATRDNLYRSSHLNWAVNYAEPKYRDILQPLLQDYLLSDDDAIRSAAIQGIRRIAPDFDIAPILKQALADPPAED